MTEERRYYAGEGSLEKKSVTTYEYDRNNRFLTETKKTEDKDKTCETHRYSYDPNGNQIRKERSVTRAETYAKTKRIGWTTEKKEKPTLDIREYNGFNQLIYCHRDVTDIYYTYRPDGMRHSVESGHSWNDGTGMTKTVHHWDGTDIVLESGGNGNIKSRFLRGINLISQNIGENDFYYVFNAHGDVIQKWNRTLNTLAQDYEYDAFGNQRKVVGIPGTEIETDANPFRYCGEYFDKETEEYYLRMRYYDPSTGRFSQRDRVSQKGMILPNGRESPIVSSLNLYTYTGNNPVAMSDPSGMFSIGNLLKSIGNSIVNTVKKFVSTVKKVVNTAVNTARTVINAVTSKITRKSSGSSNISSMTTSVNRDHCVTQLSSGGGIPDAFKGDPNTQTPLPNDRGYRYFGDDGIADYDYHSGNHGAPKYHPEDKDGGHYNDWDYTVPEHPQSGKPYVKDENGNKIYDPKHKENQEEDSGNTSEFSWERVGAGAVIVIGGIAVVVLLLDDATGIGILDNALIPPILETMRRSAEVFV